jgi:4-hydroxybenzoyl-CoA reductase subunit alpha
MSFNSSKSFRMTAEAAEVLGVQPADITVIAGDTDVTPLDVGAFTQRGTFNTGNAVKAACLDARAQIAATAAARLDVKASRLVFRDRQIYPKGEPDKALAFRQVVYDTLHSREGRFVMGRGFYNSPKETGTMAYSFGAQVVEVEVDPESGAVKVLKVTAAHDIGRRMDIEEGEMLPGKACGRSVFIDGG